MNHRITALKLHTLWSDGHDGLRQIKRSASAQPPRISQLTDVAHPAIP
ncbi:MAG: hypothetical protein ACM3OF_01950 [Gemmatimonas sp.]